MDNQNARKVFDKCSLLILRYSRTIEKQTYWFIAADAFHGSILKVKQQVTQNGHCGFFDSKKLGSLF